MIKLLFVLLKRLFDSSLGYVYWHNLIHKYKVENDCAIILLPSSEDKECIIFAVRYLRAFFEHNQYTHAIFLSNYHNLPELMDQYRIEKELYRIVECSKRRIGCLLNFYNANLNDSRLIIASLDLPKGRNGLDFLRTGVLTKEEVFLLGIYNVIDGPELNRFSKTKT